MLGLTPEPPNEMEKKVLQRRKNLERELIGSVLVDDSEGLNDDEGKIDPRKQFFLDNFLKIDQKDPGGERVPAF